VLPTLSAPLSVSLNPGWRLSSVHGSASRVYSSCVGRALLCRLDGALSYWRRKHDMRSGWPADDAATQAHTYLLDAVRGDVSVVLIGAPEVLILQVLVDLI